MSFRDDREAMRAHLENLRRELAITRAERDAMAVKLAQLEAELAAARARDRAPPPPPPPAPVPLARPKPGKLPEVVIHVSVCGAPLQELRFYEPVVNVGRAATNHVTLADVKVSRRHAMIEVTGGGVWVADLGTADGTRVNGQVINRVGLASGDLIELGDSSLRVYFES